MRLSKIIIKNYRQYQDVTFEFPKKSQNDLHIIVAQNGIGKTNSLNAINWCLYDDEPHLGDSSKSLPILNLDAKKRALEEGLNNVTVDVEVVAEDRDSTITFIRTLPVKLNPYYEEKGKFRVIIQKGTDVKALEGEDADNIVEKYMPRRIRQYFYFDGEQLHNYFSQNSSINIKETIHNITQIDLLTLIKTRLSKTLNSMERNTGVRDDDLEKVRKEKDNIDKNIAETMETIEEVNGQIHQSNIQIQNAREYLSGKEDVSMLENRRSGLKKQQNALDAQKKDLDLEFSKFVRDYKIVLSFYKPAEKVLAIITEKEHKKQLPPTIDRSLLETMIKEHKCSICEHELTKDDENKIQKIIDQIQVSSNTSNILKEIKSELSRVVNEAKSYPAKKEALLKRIKANSDQISKIATELEEVDHKYNAITDKDEIKHQHNIRIDHENRLTSNTKYLGVLEAKLEQLNKDKIEKQTQYDKYLQRHKETKRLSQKLKFGSKALRIISSIEKEMMDEVRIQMATETSDYFLQLIWKKNTYKTVSVNETYNVDLIHKDGYSCLGSCSAAERALLALSFTLALHSVSGFESLLFIDTPVARVSDINRTNFARVLANVSKEKQIIMTFTPNEYSDEISEVFGPLSSTSAILETLNEDKTIFSGGKY